MCSSAVFAGQIAMVSNSLLVKRFFTNMTDFSLMKFLKLCCGQSLHWFWILQFVLDVFRYLQEFLSKPFCWIDIMRWAIKVQVVIVTAFEIVSDCKQFMLLHEFRIPVLLFLHWFQYTFTIGIHNETWV